jgi:hypothetical protein
MDQSQTFEWLRSRVEELEAENARLREPKGKPLLYQDGINRRLEGAEAKAVGDKEIGQLFVEWMFAAGVEEEVGNKLAAALEREHRARKEVEESIIRVRQAVGYPQRFLSGIRFYSMQDEIAARERVEAILAALSPEGEKKCSEG